MRLESCRLRIEKKIEEESSESDTECILASDSDESLHAASQEMNDSDEEWVIDIDKKIKSEDLTKGKYVLCVFNQKKIHLSTIFCWFCVRRGRRGGGGDLEIVFYRKVPNRINQFLEEMMIEQAIQSLA